MFGKVADQGPCTYVYTKVDDVKTRCLGLGGQSTINLHHDQCRLYDDEVNVKDYF